MKWGRGCGREREGIISSKTRIERRKRERDISVVGRFDWIRREREREREREKDVARDLSGKQIEINFSMLFRWGYILLCRTIVIVVKLFQLIYIAVFSQMKSLFQTNSSK